MTLARRASLFALLCLYGCAAPPPTTSGLTVRKTHEALSDGWRHECLTLDDGKESCQAAYLVTDPEGGMFYVGFLIDHSAWADKDIATVAMSTRSPFIATVTVDAHPEFRLANCSPGEGSCTLSEHESGGLVRQMLSGRNAVVKVRPQGAADGSEVTMTFTVPLGDFPEAYERMLRSLRRA